MHYRSFLDLNDGKNHPQNAFLDHLGYNQKRIEEEMSDADVITSTPMTLQELGTNCLYDQFCACHPLGEKLFDTCASIIYNSKYDQYMDLGRNFNLHFYGRDQKGYYKCLTMANKKFFDAYCEFIFFMLDNVYARLKKTSTHCLCIVRLLNQGSQKKADSGCWRFWRNALRHCFCTVPSHQKNSG